MRFSWYISHVTTIPTHSMVQNIKFRMLLKLGFQWQCLIEKQAQFLRLLTKLRGRVRWKRLQTISALYDLNVLSQKYLYWPFKCTNKRIVVTNRFHLVAQGQQKIRVFADVRRLKLCLRVFHHVTLSPKMTSFVLLNFTYILKDCDQSVL